MKDYLPIGSLVTLKNGRVKLMILGYPKTIEEDKIKDKDYIACISPLGIMNFRSILAFNNDQIDHVDFMGFTSPEFDKYKNNVLNMDIESEKD